MKDNTGMQYTWYSVAAEHSMQMETFLNSCRSCAMRRSKLTCWLSSRRSSLQPTTITGAVTCITKWIIYIHLSSNRKVIANSNIHFSIYIYYYLCFLTKYFNYSMNLKSDFSLIIRNRGSIG
jgi:hypothetical protein